MLKGCKVFCHPPNARRTGQYFVPNARARARRRLERREQIARAFPDDRKFERPSHTGDAATGGRAMCERPGTVGTMEKQICGGDE